MASTECSIAYRRMRVHELPDFAGGVKICYYEHNPPFISHVITEAQFESLLENYRQTYAAFSAGGRAQKGQFMEAKNELIAALDEIKDDVNEVAQGDGTIILEGGFKPVKTYRSKPNVPDAPEIESVERGIEREILPVCKIVPGAVYYTCIVSEGAPLDPRVKITDNKLVIPKDLSTDIQIDEGKKRKKSFMYMKHLVTYYVYFFVRNSSGMSILSEPRTVLCV